MNTEPVSRVEAVRLLLVALLGAVPLFTPWTLTEAQNAGLMALYGAVSILLATWIRTEVVPVPVVNQLAERRYNAGWQRTPGTGAVRPGEYRDAHTAVKNAA